jgi:aminomethyltransferase
MGQKTDLYPLHERAGARIVDFGGWDMPLHYGSQIEEHHAVRRSAGMFDVSHMTVVDVSGREGQPREFLRALLANDIDRAATVGKAVYSCMLNEQGGVVDDLIAYWRGGDAYRLVVNAATRDKDLRWMSDIAADFDVAIRERPELAMVAVQGPEARERAAPVLDGLGPAALELKPFSACERDDWFVGRTGYTGEDGWEVILPSQAVADFWQRLADAGIRACGLGARDTLRLEAGLNLYGTDMDESTTPLESNLEWTVAMEGEREFIGRGALHAQRASGVSRKLVGLVLRDRGVLRGHQRVVTTAGDGEITSGGFSPTMEKSIALARVPASTGDSAQVEIRGKLLDVAVVSPPFVRNGRIRVTV